MTDVAQAREALQALSEKLQTELGVPTLQVMGVRWGPDRAWFEVEVQDVPTSGSFRPLGSFNVPLPDVARWADIVSCYDLMPTFIISTHFPYDELRARLSSGA